MNREFKAMSPAELEAHRILANVADLPVRGSLILADLAHDGFGGMKVMRTRANTWMFQREGYTARGRFADGLAQCLEEIEVYVNSGKLAEPDHCKGF